MGSVWGVHFRQKVLKLWKTPSFSILVKCITNVFRELRDGFQWRRCSTTLFFDNEFQESWKWGLKSIVLIFSTALMETNEKLCATRIKARTTFQSWKFKMSVEKKKNFPPLAGENTCYASCMHLQKEKPPPKASNQMRPKGCFVTSVASTRTHQETSEQTRGSTEA